MSGMRHPTISAWQRQEDGSYAAEINDWSLRVTWHPELDGGRGFTWAAERDGEKVTSEEIFEEIEVAMGAAEERVSPDPDEAPAGADDAEDAGGAGGHPHASGGHR